jgi:hypothetical protein
MPSTPTDAALRAALVKLTNEASGILGLIEPEMRVAAGHSNVNVLIQRIEEARAALRARETETPAEPATAPAETCATCSMWTRDKDRGWGRCGQGVSRDGGEVHDMFGCILYQPARKRKP